MTERMEKVYDAIADVLWENEASDVLVARLADRLRLADPEFSSSRFVYRAYRG